MATRSLEILIDEFNKLPGIGRKTAQRLAFHVFEMNEIEVNKFAEAIIEVKKSVKKCKNCGNLSENENCDICDDEEREIGVLCIVEEIRDVMAMEKTGIFEGKYHVLHGKISPLNGVGVEDINLNTLIQRIEKENISEIILALNPDLEGETTSLYISNLLKPLNIKVTRIASGIPMGGNLEFSDMATIAKSIEGRRVID